MKYAFIARERAHFPLEVLCRLLGVARSGFYDFEQRQAAPDADATVRRDLRACHQASRGTYGRPRLVKDLRDLGHRVGPKRVARMMREEGLRGRSKGRVRPRTTDSGHARPVAENLLARRFELECALLDGFGIGRRGFRRGLRGSRRHRAGNAEQRQRGEA